MQLGIATKSKSLNHIGTRELVELSEDFIVNGTVVRINNVAEKIHLSILLSRQPGHIQLNPRILNKSTTTRRRRIRKQNFE